MSRPFQFFGIVKGIAAWTKSENYGGPAARHSGLGTNGRHRKLLIEALGSLGEMGQKTKNKKRKPNQGEFDSTG